MGPFTLLSEPAYSPPQPHAPRQVWIGVPQTFLSPDRDFIFFYIHPQFGTTHSQYGLNVARMSDFRAGIRRILAANPRQATRRGLPAHDAVEQALGVGHVAPAFVNLGPLTFCQGAALPADAFVDEHFVFCGDRLHLYFTHVSTNADGQPWLRDIWHLTADLDLDVASLNTFIVHALSGDSAATSSGTQDRVRRCTGTFQPVDCKVAFDLVQHIGSEMAENIDNSNALEWVSLNDPTVYSTPTPNSIAEPMAMLFHSASLRGLVVARTANPCEPGSCP